MRSYVISTDSSADLSEAYLKEHQITMISLSCILNGETYNSENPITPKQLYDNIREGAMPTTSQVNPEQAKAAGARVVATGRSDYPNQVNNVLAFPGIFRGTFDVRARDINDDMKIAAAKAIAGLISEEELTEEYVIPAAFDERVGKAVAEAVAKAARKSGVAGK